MTVHIFDTMGTTVSIRITETPDNTDWVRTTAALDGIEKVFDLYDRDYSLYRSESPLSRLARHEVALAELSDDIRDTYARAIDWRQITHGAFTPHRPDGVIDLSGIVKADAITAAHSVLRAHGFTEYSINAGGDMTVAGEPETWVTGIAKPDGSGNPAAVVRLGGEWSAIATSGFSERGQHIWRASDPTGDIIQATVVAADIVTSDVWATAIVSGGMDTLDLATRTTGLAVLVFHADGEVRANPAMMQLMRQTAATH
ncbi:MAG: FAD:protein FMN transferase [Microbacteriaceae bacterium]